MSLPPHATNVVSSRFLRVASPVGSWRFFRTDKAAVAVSSSYETGADATALRWGDFLAQLVHGEELQGLTLYLATPTEVSEICQSFNSLGCYAPGSSEIVSIGEASDGIRPEAVVTHEYGHYIAAHRENPPWDALDWGTKRWASVVNVCAKTRAKQVFPGAEDSRYIFNPGEGFAETYRFLNGQPTGDTGMDWPIVDELFYPDARALEAVRQDVLRPWAGPTSLRLKGWLDATGHARVTVSTPLDGRLDLGAVGARIGGSSTVRRTVCGSRHTPLQLTGTPRSAFVLNVTRP